MSKAGREVPWIDEAEAFEMLQSRARINDACPCGGQLNVLACLAEHGLGI